MDLVQMISFYTRLNLEKDQEELNKIQFNIYEKKELLNNKDIIALFEEKTYFKARDLEFDSKIESYIEQYIYNNIKKFSYEQVNQLS